MQSIVIVERSDAIACVTMNQPGRRNALAPEMREALTETLERLACDVDCRAIILAGTDRSFCAGGDLSSLPAGDALASRKRMTLPSAPAWAWRWPATTCCAANARVSAPRTPTSV
ncbi:enoyl-CoA hydratase/isomerase family protein [Herbaspirillum lusitanum]|uniref:enoyl-CoA hydratase/isomerase family protein n=1 Tax=Herbaspirillum lusitanum TaxID=213312 RepID=UPI00031AE313|nr:enoyl-CoA hydratase/isomerase family protein [Herbaspirillum lusitanum]